MQALSQLDLQWFKGSDTQSKEAAHLFYNLLIAVLGLWRNTNDIAFRVSIIVNSIRYPDILVTIAPNTAPYTPDLRPNLAGAVVLSIMKKCLSTTPSYWSTRLVSRGEGEPVIGLVFTGYNSQPFNATGSELASNASSTTSTLRGDSLESNQSLGIKASVDITTQLDFNGRLPDQQPQLTWLTGFLGWLSDLLRFKGPDETITATPRALIYEVTITTPDGFSFVFSSRAGTKPAGSHQLTYDELFRGIQSIFEVVVVTGQFEFLEAAVYKDGWMAADFRVFARSHGGSPRSNIAIS